MKRITTILILIITLTGTLVCLSSCSCGTCSGSGLIACKECEDRRCNNCDDGYLYCDVCNGRGHSYETCSICDGKGFIMNPITWQTFSCDIIEEIDCSYCYDGKVDCPVCDGDGITGEDCFCGSDRMVACPDCSDLYK